MAMMGVLSAPGIKSGAGEPKVVSDRPPGFADRAIFRADAGVQIVFAGGPDNVSSAVAKRQEESA